jgi:uncharacterized protein (DUF1697 family)
VATYVALLRGINIGKRQLPMAALRSACEDAGCTEVQTYVQSGNVVLRDTARSALAVQRRLAQQISDAAGFDVLVVVRTAKEMAAVVAGNPYPHAAGKQLHVAFLDEKPGKAQLTPLDAAATNGEGYTVAARDIYLHLPNGMGQSKLGAAMSKLSLVATVRNWNTVTTLADMAKG